MNPWDLATWVAVTLLGPGAIVVFAAFVRDLLQMRRRGRDGDGGASPGSLD